MDIKAMDFAKVYDLLLNKLLRKGHDEDELKQLIQWLCGYTNDQIDQLKASSINYGDFFDHAPCMNPNRFMIKGKICGVTIETIEDSIIKDMRILDKLVDDLAKGKSIERLLSAGSTN